MACGSSVPPSHKIPEHGHFATELALEFVSRFGGGGGGNAKL